MSRNNLNDEEELRFGADEPELEDDNDEDKESDESSSDSNDDELPDSLPEESMADEPEIEHVKETKKRDKAKVRINQLQRDKFHAINESEKLRAENEQLRQMYESSTQVAMRQYDDSVAKRIERARESQIAAIESGDAQAQADANIELASATNEMHTLNNWKYQNEYELRNQTAYVPEQPIYYSNNNDSVLQDWIEDNTWFNPSSKNHDPDLAAYINNKSSEIDQGLIQHGYGYKIRDEDYFREIDRLAQEYVNGRNRQYSGQRRDLNMKPVRGGASPVRGYNQGVQGSGQTRETLSADERDMARRMGVTDKVYLQHRLHDQKINGFKRRGGR